MSSTKLNHEIIALVKENEFIWKYKSKLEYEEGWKHISKKIGKPVEECKRRWIELDDRFNKLLKQTDVNWIHFKELLFLKDALKRKKNNTKIGSNILLKEYNQKEDDIISEENFPIEFTNFGKFANEITTQKDQILCNKRNLNVELLKSKTLEDETTNLKNIGIKYGEIFFYENQFFYSCLFCDENFDSNEEFTVHCLIGHLNESSIIEVDELFDSKENIDLHKQQDNKILIEIERHDKNTPQEIQYDQNLEDYKLNHFSVIDYETSRSDLEIETCSGGLNLKCALCPFRTKKLKMILEHGEDNHPGEAIFKCFKCPQVFEKYDNLLHHKISCQKFLNCCNICDTKFKSKTELRQHLTMHKSNTKILELELEMNSSIDELAIESYFKCGLCNFETLEKEYFIEHCSNEHLDEAAFKCEICNILFSNFSLLEDHGNDVHNIIKDTYSTEDLKLNNSRKDITTTKGRLHREILKCGCCDFETQIIKNFLQHCEKHISKGEKPFKCWVCDKIFKKYRYLIYHRRLHRRLNDSACSFCGKQFHTYRSLRDHERGHTGERTIFRCQYCNKEFCYAETLRDHENIHTGNRPYKCTFCERDFSLRSTWQTHVRVKHLNDKRFECKTCGLKCLKRRDALEHEASHSGNKLYVCDICGNTYSKNSALVSHLKSHENLRNYKCEICGKGFNTATNLSRHMWVHSEDKNWACEFCGNKFVCKKNLKQHIKTHFKNVVYSCEGCSKVFTTKATFELHHC